jgi:hypothetical protein
MNVNIRAYFSSLALIVSLLSGEACAQQPLVKVGVCTIRQSPQLYIDSKTNLVTGAYVDLMNSILCWAEILYLHSMPRSSTCR